jgi:hypothetical protein
MTDRNVRGRRQLCRAALVVCLLAFPAALQAQAPVSFLEEWNDVGTAGWTNGSPDTGLVNGGGFLNVQFVQQPRPDFRADLARRTLDGRVLPTNICFRFAAPDVKPSALRVYLHSAERGNTWYVNVPVPSDPSWVRIGVPVSHDAGWIMGPCSAREQFESDMKSVDWVGVYVRRHGSVNEQNYGIDDFELQGLSLPDSVSIAGVIGYEGEQTGPIRISAREEGTSPQSTYSVDLSSAGPYEIGGLTPYRDYHVTAYCDANTNSAMEAWEASGAWTANPARVTLTDLSDIDLSIVDPVRDDGLPGWWVYRHFPQEDPMEAGSGLGGKDGDGDTMDNYAEYRAGTDPNDTDSRFEVSIECTNRSDGLPSVVLRWNSIPHRSYAVRRGRNLVGGLNEIDSGLATTPPANRYEDVTATNAGPHFYRIEIE